MAASPTNEFHLRPLPCYDGKWLRADLQSALRSTEDLSNLWNNLVKDGEMVSVSASLPPIAVINSTGNISYLHSSGRFYCGAEKLNCSCCTGFCRPSTDCNCTACSQLDADEHVNKRNVNDATTENISASDATLDSWLWSQMPGDEEKNTCIRLLLSEQRELSLQAAGHSLSAIHLRQRLFVYHRYLIALSRLQQQKSMNRSAAVRKTLSQNEQLKKMEMQKAESLELKQQQSLSTAAAVERATFGLARVGTRAALNFSFAFLRRAWRSGEDTELCSELLQEALDALQGLPEASLFDTAQVSTLWLEALERSVKFLRQVVLGDLDGRCSVPRADRHIALSLLLELESQKGSLSASLEAIWLLLTLWEKEKDVDDNRTQQMAQNNAAPLRAILKRYEAINRSDNEQTADLSNTSLAPTDSFLR